MLLPKLVELPALRLQLLRQRLDDFADLGKKKKEGRGRGRERGQGEADGRGVRSRGGALGGPKWGSWGGLRGLGGLGGISGVLRGSQVRRRCPVGSPGVSGVGSEGPGRVQGSQREFKGSWGASGGVWGVPRGAQGGPGRDFRVPEGLWESRGVPKGAQGGHWGGWGGSGDPRGAPGVPEWLQGDMGVPRGGLRGAPGMPEGLQGILGGSVAPGVPGVGCGGSPSPAPCCSPAPAAPP